MGTHNVNVYDKNFLLTYNEFESTVVNVPAVFES